MRKDRPIVLMRTEPANRPLAERLEKEGLPVWIWPAFSIEPPAPAQVQRLKSRLADLSDVSHVVVPSPSAVQQVGRLIRAWPAHITLCAVGAGTAAAIERIWGKAVRVLSPRGDVRRSGSEALWELIQADGMPSHILFLRGQSGREWLPGQFRRHGVKVTVMCAYQRVAMTLTPARREQLVAAMKGEPPVIYISSTHAVEALRAAVSEIDGAFSWFCRGIAVTLHPRIEQKLYDVGYKQVLLTDAPAAAVQACIGRALQQLG